jgi:hypothetical protein
LETARPGRGAVDRGKGGSDAEPARHSFALAFRRSNAHTAAALELADNVGATGDAGMRTLHNERRTLAGAVALERALEVEGADKVSRDAAQQTGALDGEAPTPCGREVLRENGRDPSSLGDWRLHRRPGAASGANARPPLRHITIRAPPEHETGER